jgi:hypothetical protein
MNCKPGDLAVVVRSEFGNAGRIVEVLKPLGVEPYWGGFRWDGANSKGAFCWLVRALGAPLHTMAGGQWQECPVPDAVLKPLRDSDGEDEVLLIVGRPVGDPQAA